MDKTILFWLFLPISLWAQEDKQRVEKDGMSVTWYHEADRIHFEMSAPTQGWITIGFNEDKGMQDAYLLMGSVWNKRVEVVEHYTQAPGRYHSIASLGGRSMVGNVDGKESERNTVIRFSVPTNAQTAFRKNLSPGRSYFLTLAFSQEDDFQHHSIMRTSVSITL